MSEVDLELLQAQVEVGTQALEETGDLMRVTHGIERLQNVGTGSQRQTHAFHDGGTDAVLGLITVRS